VSGKRRAAQLAPKAASVGLGGSLSIIVVWLISMAGVEVPDAVAGALATLFGFGAAYLTEEA
jgi:hypothetical protein